MQLAMSSHACHYIVLCKTYIIYKLLVSFVNVLLEVFIVLLRIIELSIRSYLRNIFMKEGNGFSILENIFTY